MMEEQIYFGLLRISERLKMPRGAVRRMIEKGYIRAFRIEGAKNSPVCCIESTLCEDLRKIAKKNAVNI